MDSWTIQAPLSCERSPSNFDAWAASVHGCLLALDNTVIHFLSETFLWLLKQTRNDVWVPFLDRQMPQASIKWYTKQRLKQLTFHVDYPTIVTDILLCTYTHHKHMHGSTHMHSQHAPLALFHTQTHANTNTHTQITYTTDVIDPPTPIALLVEPTIKCFELTQFGCSNENKAQSLWMECTRVPTPGVQHPNNGGTL